MPNLKLHPTAGEPEITTSPVTFEQTDYRVRRLGDDRRKGLDAKVFV